MNQVTRHYVDVHGRRVHYRRTGRGPPVVMLHESPRSSAALLPLIDLLPGDLTVFALDTPGYGQSDPMPAHRTSLVDFGGGVEEVYSALGIRRAPVYGTHTGASIAYELAHWAPDMCPLAIMDGFPVFTALEREEALASYLPPFHPAVDGTHLAWLWSRVRDQTLFFPWYRRGAAARLHLPLATPERLHAIALDMLRAGDHYRTAYAAAFASQPLKTLGGHHAPIVFGARVDDVLLGHLDRLPPLPDDCTAERFAAAGPDWAASIHRHMMATASGDAPPPTQAALPADRPGVCYVDLPHGQVHVRGTMGKGGSPHLLLHGLPGSALDWRRKLHLYYSVPVLAPDLPGCGDSDPLPGGGLDDVLEVLVALVDRFGFDQIWVAGRGTGAILALALHQRDQLRFLLDSLGDLPQPGAVPPEAQAFAPHPFGTHLFAAWPHIRDAAILGGWERREPAPFDMLDADSLHADTVELLKARADPTPLIHTLLALPYAEWARAHPAPRSL